MSKELLKSIVQKLKEKKDLKEWGVVDCARIQKVKTPLISKIADYLKDNKKLSHAQYYELIAMANGYPNFDSFKPIIDTCKLITPIKTGSILLDTLLSQNPNGFKISETTEVTPANYKKKTLKDLIEIVQDFKFKLKLYEFDLTNNASLLKLSLYGNSEDLLILRVYVVKNKLALDCVEIPLTINNNQIIINRELEIYTLACAYGIVNKRGGVHDYKDIKIMGKDNFVKLLSENSSLLNELETLCLEQLNKNFSPVVEEQNKGGQPLQYFSGLQADEIRLIVKEELTKAGIMDQNGMIHRKKKH